MAHLLIYKLLSKALNSAILIITIVTTGPGLWVTSQLLLLLYFWLDNGSNTCGIDFHFENNKKEEDPIEEGNGEIHLAGIEDRISPNSVSRVETEDAPEDSINSSSIETEDDSKSLINGDESKEDTFIEFKILEKLFIGKFKVGSKEGR